jgi:hypothetical protein
MGCKHRMSKFSGMRCKNSCFGNCFTDSTSATSVFRRKRCMGNALMVASVERMLVQKITTSGCISQKSSGSR